MYVELYIYKASKVTDTPDLQQDTFSGNCRLQVVTYSIMANGLIRLVNRN